MVPESQGHSATRSTSQPSWPPSLRSAADRLRNRFPTNTGQLSPSVSTMVSTPAGRAPPCKKHKNKMHRGRQVVGDREGGEAGAEGRVLTPLRGQDARRRPARRTLSPDLSNRTLPAPLNPPPLQTRAQTPRDPRSPKFRFSKTLNLNTERVRRE